MKGYRPILDAMKSFAIDEHPIDIEELTKLKCINHSNTQCISKQKKRIHLINNNDEWYSPKSLPDLLDLLDQYKNSSYKIVSGNTGTGVYKNDGPYNVFIDIRNIPELFLVRENVSELTVGSGFTIKMLIDLFEVYSQMTGFEYLKTIAKHFSKIANVGIRNTGTWSGNLGIKNSHLEFPSDVFVCFESVNATINLIGPGGVSTMLKCSELLNTSLRGKLIFTVTFKPIDPYSYYQTFKIMPRSQNAHAYVNAAFLFNLDSNHKVKSIPSIVFGGINQNFIHAAKTEAYLMGKQFDDINILSNAFEILTIEIDPNPDPVLSSPEYRKSLALSLFYKFVLFVNQYEIDKRFTSALDVLLDKRPISSGIQDFSSDAELYPVTKPMTKLNALLQASGEAKYVYDMPMASNDLNATFIMSSNGNCRLDNIDLTEALMMPGVVKILLAKDIPGVNSFTPPPLLPEKLLCDDMVDYAGQAVGVVIANTFEQAVEAAKFVKITYKEMKKPILTIDDAIKQNSFFPNPPNDFIYGDAEKAISNATYVIEGEVKLGTQFHFFMEGHVAVASLNDDGMDVYSSTQWLDLVQSGVSQVLGLKSKSQINVMVKQLGGSYGGKITRSNIVATGAALASYSIKRKVRLAIDLATNMEMVGKRFPWYAQYKIGIDSQGKLLGVELKVYVDCGKN